MIGQLVSHYQIQKKIGAGGMGEVYLAEDTKLKRMVALKFLPKESTRDKDAVERFEREAQAAAALNHPHIVTIFEINQYENQTYIAMEYVEGRTLKEIIASGPLPLPQALDIAIEICAGLSAAHKQGIIHRDIKPQNILVDKEGRVKILDFGLAKLRIGENGGLSGMTQIGTTLGTINYMSPEQALGKEVDHRTDIWSMGVVLYEMLTGQLPFKGDYEQAVIYSIINEAPQPFLEDKARFPAELKQIIHKTLAKNPRDRYPQVEDIINDMRAFSLSGEKPIDQNSQSIINTPKTRWPLTMGLLIVILMFLMATVYLIQSKAGRATAQIDSLAVLPLKNLSGDPGQEYFSDGMTEALITELSRIKSLKVISRTSVMRFKNTRQSLPEIARQLKVAAVVEGSVMKAGEKVRITTQLIEAVRDKHLWAESYERDLEDILSLQKEVARTIAGQIRTTLTTDEKNRLSETSTIDPAAHEAYLKGRHFLDQITVESGRRAMGYFDRVIQLEPDFAPAYIGKAETYDLFTSLGELPHREGWGLVNTWAEKALKIDPENSDAFMLMADVKYLHEWDWSGAEEAYKKSIELNPNNVTATNWYAVFLSSMGRKKEAIPMINKAFDLAPLSIPNFINAAHIYLDAGMVEKGEHLLEKFKELFPGHPYVWIIQIWIFQAKAQYHEALEFIKSQGFQAYSSGNRQASAIIMADIFARTGHRDRAGEILNQLIDFSKTHPASAFSVALVYSALGEIDPAFLWMEKAYKQHSDLLPKYMKSSSPLLDNLRPDPRFKEMLIKMKLYP